MIPCFIFAIIALSEKRILFASSYNSGEIYVKLSDNEYNVLTEDEKRIYRRNQVRKGNYNLNKTAINSGVKDLARFHNAGYKGLYDGNTADDIFKRKKLLISVFIFALDV